MSSLSKNVKPVICVINCTLINEETKFQKYELFSFLFSLFRNKEVNKICEPKILAVETI